MPRPSGYHIDPSPQVVTKIGPENFRGISSDSTGNTAGARALMLKEWDWMVELPDSCHRLGLLAKDICKIEQFLSVSHFSFSDIYSKGLTTFAW